MEERLEKILYNVDFSKDTDLKERLARRLFRSGSKSRAAIALTDDEAELVSAAAALEKDYMSHRDVVSDSESRGRWVSHGDVVSDSLS